MPPTIKIRVRAVDRHGNSATTIGSKILCSRSRTPFLDSARALIKSRRRSSSTARDAPQKHSVPFRTHQRGGGVMTAPTRSWRDTLPIHPVAELFPLMSEAELRELGQDIKKNGLTSPIALWRDNGGKISLLDGRNRLDAMGAAGVDHDRLVVL